MKSSMLAIAGLVAGAVGTAAAGPIVSFGYTEVSGAYDSSTSTFSGTAVDNGSLQTAGDVSRIVATTGTANFDAGFVSRSASADIGFSLIISNNTGSTADASGTITLVDDDGDSILADVMGTFTDGGTGVYFFTGLLDNVTLVGSEFNGTDGGAWDMDLPGNEPYDGALVQLFLDSGSDFFTSDFADVSVQVDGEIVPTPGTAALLALAGGLTARRRR